MRFINGFLIMLTVLASPPAASVCAINVRSSDEAHLGLSTHIHRRVALLQSRSRSHSDASSLVDNIMDQDSGCPLNGGAGYCWEVECKDINFCSKALVDAMEHICEPAKNGDIKENIVYYRYMDVEAAERITGTTPRDWAAASPTTVYIPPSNGRKALNSWTRVRPSAEPFDLVWQNYGDWRYDKMSDRKGSKQSALEKGGAVIAICRGPKTPREVTRMNYVERMYPYNAEAGDDKWNDIPAAEQKKQQAQFTTEETIDRYDGRFSSQWVHQCAADQRVPGTNSLGWKLEVGKGNREIHFRWTRLKNFQQDLQSIEKYLKWIQPLLKNACDAAFLKQLTKNVNEITAQCIKAQSGLEEMLKNPTSTNAKDFVSRTDSPLYAHEMAMHFTNYMKTQHHRYFHWRSKNQPKL